MSEAKGINGTVRFDNGVVIIERTGLNARMTQGSGGKSFPLSTVGSVQLVKPSLVKQGYFQIASGGDVSVSGRKANVALAKDENTVLVNKKQFPQFEALRDSILAARV